MNGTPLLQRGMNRKVWSEVMNDAFNDLRAQISAGKPTIINAYAATHPAEFFAVLSEYYFTAPNILKTHYADVFKQLSLFYQQKVLV
jgi:MtfA peptidase